MIARALLGLAALLLALGGTMHLKAYPKAVAAVAASNLADYFGNALKALWLMDSAGMFALAVACAVIAARPGSASGLVIATLGTIPAATAILLYVFIGPFIGAHVLIATAAAILAAGALT
jgi:hypothetical protein